MHTRLLSQAQGYIPDLSTAKKGGGKPRRQEVGFENETAAFFAFLHHHFSPAFLA
jgi:hypothetical protein